MSEQQAKRGPGRPRLNHRKERIDVTISHEAIRFVDWLIGETGNLSGFIDEQIKAHPRYEEWKHHKTAIPADSDSSRS